LNKDDPDYVPGRLPEMVEWLFVERLEQGLGPEPVFAYLHLMPPHSPYIPSEGHDLWGDPAYRGEIDGSTEQLELLVNHQLAWNEADLKRLISLYDGGLHRIDASVGRILDAWRKLPRERDLLIVVMSDHGEAFAEHGQFEHLSTVYDEMLTIPTIFWPRHRWQHLVRAQDRLTAITDIMPLILAKVGVGVPESAHWPRRFLDLMQDPNGRSREAILARSFTDTHRFGFRNDRYLAIFNGFLEQELYDVQADPQTQRNLRIEQPELYTRMIVQMRHLMDTASVRQADQDHELSDEDLEALKSLGYL
jgi:arylsulfatase A-like enzyme